MKDIAMQNGGFETSDIDVAAFLLTHNVTMSGISRQQDRLIFVFSRPDQCRRLTQRFMVGDDTTSAKTLLAASKHLRRLVRENL